MKTALVALGLAAILASRGFAEAPAHWSCADEQNGESVVVTGLLTVEHKGTTHELFRVDRYKVRGVSREKLLPLLNQQVRVTGQFRQLLNEIILYAQTVEAVPKPEDDGDK